MVSLEGQTASVLVANCSLIAMRSRGIKITQYTNVAIKSTFSFYLRICEGLTLSEQSSQMSILLFYRTHPKDGGRYCFQFVCQSTPRGRGRGTPARSGW